jgi:hypothetical protein
LDYVSVLSVLLGRYVHCVLRLLINKYRRRYEFMCRTPTKIIRGKKTFEGARIYVLYITRKTKPSLSFDVFFFFSEELQATIQGPSS